MRIWVVAAALSASAGAQVPPPPSLPDQPAIAARLRQALESNDLDGYAAVLSSDLKVYDDAKLVSSSKADWLSKFRSKLTAAGVSFSIVSAYESTGRFLFLERFNSAGSWGGDVPAHCCWSTDAVAYVTDGSTITAIYRMVGGQPMGDASPRTGVPTVP